MSEFLDHSSFRPFPHAERRAAEDIRPAMDRLQQSGVCIPSPLLWDLLYAPTRLPFQPGDRSEDIADHDQWRRWVEVHWSPLARMVGCDSLGNPPVRLAAQFARHLGAIEDHPARKVSVRALLEWNWPGGPPLRRIVSGSELDPDPAEMIGLSAILEQAGSIDRADPFLWSADRAEGVVERAPNTIGRFTDAIARSRILGPVGEFARRRPGALPSDAARMSPLEVLLLDEVPDYFWRRVAENQIDQRFHHRPGRRDRRLSVELVVEVRDSLDLHRFAGGSSPLINNVRQLLVELVRHVRLVVAGWRVRIDLLIEHRPALGGSARVARIDTTSQESEHPQSESVMLARVLPGLMSHHPIPLAAKSGPGRRPGAEFDHRVRVVIAAVNRSAPVEPDGDHLIRCTPRHGDAWLVSESGSGLVDGQVLERTDAARLVVESAIGGSHPIPSGPARSAGDWKFA